MMAPSVYRNARLNAQWHLQARILERNGAQLTVRVTRVLRGPMAPGVQLTFPVSITPEGPPIPGGTIYAAAERIDSARYIEVFLSGWPPEVVLDQIKYLPEQPPGPVGDPSVEDFLW